MPVADCVLLLANVLYATSYVATRLTLAHVPPAMLALFRLLIAAAILLPLAWWRPRVALTAREHVSVAAMGVIGFAAAFVLANEGLARSTVTNAALLIAIEPLTVMLLGPLLLGEHLTSREKAGAALAVLGAVLVVVNGVPGVTAAVVPHWRGDLLLLCSGVAYAAYTLIGRPVLSQRPALPVTAYSIGWGIPALVPVVAAEWLAGTRPMPDGVAVAGTLYLGAVVTAGGYLVWNWALERVPAPRAAVFLNIQPVAGAMLGVLVFGEPLTVFTITGGLFVVAGLGLAVRACATPGAVRAVRRRAPAARPARGTRCRE
jgi:drug/metabolite transporter (DMT)-like permease